jgi:hypothetical protein
MSSGVNNPRHRSNSGLRVNGCKPVKPGPVRTAVLKRPLSAIGVNAAIFFQHQEMAL